MHVKRSLQFLLFACCFIAQQATAQSTSYCNERFGFCISYPANLLKPEPEAQNGDGRHFNDAQGVDRLTVYGSGDWNFNEEGTTVPLSTVYQQELHGGHFADANAHRVITYKALGKTSFVISGTEKGEIFYLKVIRKEDAFCFAYLHYPVSSSKQYSPVAALVAKTFR